MKTLIISALAAASIVSAASAATAYTYDFTGVSSSAYNVGYTITLGEVTATVTSPNATYGAWYWGGATTEWSNTAALTAMNTDLGTSATASNLDGIIAIGNGANTTLTLSFADTSYVVGESITLYVTVGARDSALDDLTLSGLGSSSIEYATNTGDGFSTTASYSTGTSNQVTLLKITGTLTDSMTVSLTSTTSKNGIGYIALASSAASVPEPATATLSLLALAGLAARRRRK